MLAEIPRSRPTFETLTVVVVVEVKGGVDGEGRDSQTLLRLAAPPTREGLELGGRRCGRLRGEWASLQRGRALRQERHSFR